MPNDVEFKTFHELLKAATRLPPLKIAAAMPRRSPSSTDRRRPPSKVFEVRSRGQVDLLLVPDLVSGNIFAKNLEYLAEATLGGVVLGRWFLSFSSRGPILRGPIWLPRLSPVCCSLDSRLAVARGPA